MLERTDQGQMKDLIRLAEDPAQVGNHKFADVIFNLAMSVPSMYHKAEGYTHLSPTTFVSLIAKYIVILGNEFQG